MPDNLLYVYNPDEVSIKEGMSEIVFRFEAYADGMFFPSTDKISFGFFPFEVREPTELEVIRAKLLGKYYP